MNNSNNDNISTHCFSNVVGAAILSIAKLYILALELVSARFSSMSGRAFYYICRCIRLLAVYDLQTFVNIYSFTAVTIARNGLAHCE